MLASLHGSVSPVWPASGVSIWLLIAHGRALWPAVAIGALAANVGTGVSLSVVLAITAGNTLEALVGAWLWQRGQQWWREMPELQDFVGCLAASLMGSVASATVGVAALLISGGVSADLADKLWITWWTGDTLGVLALLPVLLAGPELRRMAGAASVSGAAKAAGVLAVAAGVGWLAFMVPGAKAALFAIFPVLLLAVGWFGAPGARLVALLISAGGITAAYLGHGPFTSGEPNQNLLNLQVFLAAVAVTALVLPLFGTGRRNWMPAVVLLTGWTLSGWMFNISQRESVQNQGELFRERVAAADAAIHSRIATYIDVMRGGAGLFIASASVSREEWRAYAQSLELAKFYPAINAYGVLFPVAADQEADWLARIRADGVPALVIKPFPATTGREGDVKYVITYTEPVERSLTSLGRNIATDPSRRKAAELARDTGEARMNRRIPGSRDAQRRAGFLLYMPFYTRGAPIGTTEERRAAHAGWVYAQFFADNFFRDVLGPVKDTLQLHFFDDGELTREHLLYASAPGRPSGNFERVTALELAGQRFSLGWQRGPRYPAGKDSPMMWAAASFAFATLLLAALVSSLQDFRRRAEHLALQRTTELTRAERLLASANRLQSAVLNGTSYSIIGTNPQGIVEIFNTGAERMLGYTSAEVVGRQTLAAWHLPEEVEAHAARLTADLGRPVGPGFEALVARPQRGGVDEREWTYVRKDGSRLPVYLSVTALRNEQRAVTGFLGIAYDLTEKKAAIDALRASEQQLKDVFRSMAEGVVLQDVSGAITDCNSAAESILGLTRDQVLGRSSLDPRWQTVRGDGSPFPGAEHPAMITLRTGEACLGVEMGVRKPGGEVTWIMINSQPIRRSGGDMLGVACSFADVTERRQLFDNLAVARDQALEGSRLKSEFLANMSHEIRTPMNGVIGMTALLMETALTESQREMGQVIQSSAENLLVIVNDILDFSKIEAGKLRIESAAFELRPLVEESIALLTPRALEKSLKLSGEFDPQLDGAMLGDGGRIRQVLVNLLGNAVKFTESGVVAVGARCLEAHAEHRRLRIEITDTGIGIPEAAKRLLFQPFNQADGSTTRRFGGTGLGLAISRQLVELMGGEIGFSSEEGRGSTFWFQLKLARHSGPANRTAPAVTGAIPFGRQKPRVLVAEDNDTNRLVARRLLEKMGCEVCLAGNGAEALRWLAEHPCDAVLMDCQMPEMNGYQATERIRAGGVSGLNQRIPIIALTAFALPSVREKCLAVGMDDYLTKPLRMENLRQALLRCGLQGAGVEAGAPVPSVTDTSEGVLHPGLVQQLRELPGRKHPTLLDDVVEIFLDDTPGVLASFRDLVARQDRQEIGMVAHRLAGSAANLGAQAMLQAARGVEAAADEAAWTEMPGRLRALDHEWQRLQSVLQQMAVHPTP